MNSPTNNPSVRDLIAELARLEDQMRAAEALVHGAVQRPDNPEMLGLHRRETQLLALLRQRRTTG